MKTLHVTREKLDKLLTDQDGKFFTVVFRKLDYSLRTLNGRLGVKKYLKGGTNKITRYDNPYITVFEVNGLEYRTVNLHTIKQVRANNTIYKVIED